MVDRDTMNGLSGCVRLAGAAALAALCACAQAPPHGVDAGRTESAGNADPTRGEVLLPGAAEGWRAALVHDNGDVGVWTVESHPVFPQYATPEVVGLDDEGRCWIMISYSGKWTPVRVLEDGAWLGGLAHADADPRVAGAELYVGGKLGRLYQVRSHADGGVDARRIATLPGRELHTIVAGELDPRHPGRELLVFTRPGGLYRVSPDGEHGGFRTAFLGDLPSRVRDAVVLPDGRTVACARRGGEVATLRIEPDGLRWDTVHALPMGRGRLALAPVSAAGRVVLYSTADDGRIFRHAGAPGGPWTTEMIDRGPQGPRGIAAGRFDPDPATETVAVFGYSGRVELLRRTPRGWTVALLFTDRGKGHWLAAAELDGRNATDELLLSGYGARMVMLARDPTAPLPSRAPVQSPSP